jgi:glycosyltransferase involved in cell wall biosynthesis
VSVDTPVRGVLQVVLTLEPGGTERLVIDIAKAVASHHASAVCCIDHPGAWAGELEAVGIPVVALGRGAGFQPRLGLEIAAAARRFGCNVLHCHQYSTFVYGRLATWRSPRLGMVYTEHGRLDDAPPSRKRRLVNPVLAAGPGLYTTVSDDLGAYMATAGFPAARLRTVYNGIPLPAAPVDGDRQRARDSLGLAADDFVVGTIARLDPIKNLSSLLDGLAWVRRTTPLSRGRLVIIGDGPDREILERRTSELQLAPWVVLAGHRAQASRLLPAFDVYLNSSIKEGISLSILEAMAAEVPVVATAVGGTPEIIVDGRSGMLVPSGAPERQAAGWLALESDVDRRQRLAAAGRSRVLDQFTSERMVAQYMTAYGQVARRT